MLQLVENEGHNFHLAASPLTKGRYVDDIFGAADTIEELQITAQRLQAICQHGCFPLQKWSANAKEALPYITSDCQPDAVVIQSEDSNVKLLGLVWNSTDDNFKFTLQLSFSNDITKRTVLSETASLFDPLGFISLVIITAKVFLQELWLARLQWDDILPLRLQRKWLQFGDNLSDLLLFSLPRWLQISSSSTVEIHGFSDASQLAMSATVYLRSTSSDGSSTVTLVCSKTKVAPLKRQTIPLLELMAALFLSRLVSHVQTTLELSNIPVSLWTDSAVTLAWITSHPPRLERLRQKLSHSRPGVHFNGEMAVHFGKGEPGSLRVSQAHSSGTLTTPAFVARAYWARASTPFMALFYGRRFDGL